MHHHLGVVAPRVAKRAVHPAVAAHASTTQYGGYDDDYYEGQELDLDLNRGPKAGIAKQASVAVVAALLGGMV